MPPAIALGIGAGISGIGSIAGGIMGANAAGDAADKQSAASMYSANLQKQMYDQQRSDMSPWRQGGMQAMYGNGGLFSRTPGTGTGNGGGNLQTDWTKSRLQSLKDERQHKFENINDDRGQAVTDELRRQFWATQPDSALEKQAADDWGTMGVKETAGQIDPSLYQIDPNLTRGFTADDFQKDPGYDFRMKEGQKALERSAAAKGGLQTGGFMKSLGRYGQDYASGEYQNAYNRFNNDQSNRFNRLASISGLGQTTSAQLGQAGQNYATGVGNTMTGMANAQGAAGMAQSNALGGMVGGIGKTWMDYSLAKGIGNKEGWFK